MAKNRYIEERGRVKPADLPLGPAGRALCRYCQIEVPVGRRTFCSDRCVHEWKLRSQNTYLRETVFQRDRGRCSGCGLDTQALDGKIKRLLRLGDLDSAGRILFRLGLDGWLAGWTHKGPPRSIWEAHHVKGVFEGGGECALVNIRTLCYGCHKKMTLSQAKSRGATRREKTPSESLSTTAS